MTQKRPAAPPQKNRDPKGPKLRDMLQAADWNTFEPPNKDQLQVARVYVNYGIESGVNLNGDLIRVANRRKFPVVAGDLVYTDGKTVEGVMPRGKVLARFAEESGVRLIASHLDQVGLVCAASDPPFQETFADRYMVYCRIIGLPLFFVMNKMDEGDEEIKKRMEPYERNGVDVIYVSALTGRGFAELRKRLSEGITVLSGLSGVGKSTIINRVLRDDELIPTQELTKYGRGRHTTTAAEVYDFKETLLIDTPGIKLFGFLGVSPEQVVRGFPDIEEIGQNCRWPGCTHRKEGDCAVKAAVEEGRLPEMRLRAYREILAQIEAQHEDA